MSSSSWSDLSLDLLIKIKNTLQSYEYYDIGPFRLVCTHWRSAMPASNPLPCYDVSHRGNTIYFRTNNEKSCRSIPLPMLFQSPVNFLCSSNGWLAFLTRYNDTLYLFDPVSNLILIFPSISEKLFSQFIKFKPNVTGAHHISIWKVVVSSCVEGGIAMASIVTITTNEAKWAQEKRLAFCRYDNRPRWSLLMEESKGIADIAFAGDNRFYAISEDWVLYMLDERPQMLQLKRFKLLLPEHILAPYSVDDPTDLENDPNETASIKICYYMKECGESDLMIYGCRWRSWNGGTKLYFKIDVTKLHDSVNNDNNIAVEAELPFNINIPCFYSKRFIPSIRERSLKVEVQNKGEI